MIQQVTEEQLLEVTFNSEIKEIVHKSDIVEYQNVFTKEQCDYMIDYWNSLDDWMLSCFYNSYTISGRKPPELDLKRIEAGPKLREIQLTSHKLAEKVFNRRLRGVSLSAHRWDPGSFAGDHADNAELDGTPNAWEENKLVTMIYLNDDFEGGHLTFRDHNLAFRPKTGSVIVFDVGINNVHAVTEVVSGQRYTMLGSYDYIENTYDKDFNKLKSQYDGIREKQKQDWEKGIIPDPETMVTTHTIVN